MTCKSTTTDSEETITPINTNSTTNAPPKMDARVVKLLKRHFVVKWQKSPTVVNKDKAQKAFDRLARARRTPVAIDRADHLWNSCGAYFRAIQKNVSLETQTSQDAVDEIKTLMTRSPAALDTFMASDFVLLKKIGHGGFGRVYMALHIPTGHTVALKQLDRDSSSVETHDHRTLPLYCGVVPCYGTFRALGATNTKGESISAKTLLNGDADFELKHWMVLKLCPNGTLKDRLLALQGGLPTRKEAANILRKVAKTLTYLHEKHGIVHNDVKPANILLDDNNGVLLCDLGCARKGKWQTERIGGTYTHMSPEKLKARKDPSYCVNGNYYNDPKADVWSLGVMLHEMLFFGHPFLDYKIFDKCATARQDDKVLEEVAQAYESLSLPTECHTAPDGFLLLNLFQSMLCTKPETRMSLSQLHLRKHPWLQRHGTWADRTKLKMMPRLGLVNSTTTSTRTHQQPITVRHVSNQPVPAIKATASTDSSDATKTSLRSSFPSIQSEQEMEHSS